MEPGTYVRSLVVEGRRAKLSKPLPPALFSVAPKMEGNKRFTSDGGFSFEPTHHNMKVFTDSFPGIGVDDKRETYARFAGVIQGGLSGEGLGLPTGRPVYRSLTSPYGDFQVKATEHCLTHDHSALFMEQGTGKSKIAIDVAGTRWCAGQITGLLVITFNGVHVQWVEEAIPAHLGDMVPRRTWANSGRKLPDWLFETNKLAVFTINFESCHTKEGRNRIEAFVTAHGGRVMCVVDESQRIKNDVAKSTQEIWQIGRWCKYRMIMSGTPIAKTLEDVWSQFKFLDESIIGYQYKTAFRAKFCRMHPKLRGVVVGSKNEREFYEIIAPYTYRVTKEEELDLPPKVYDRVEFELHPDQRKVYDDLRNKFIVKLDSGDVTTVKNAAILVMRLHQITCGYLALDKDDPDEATKFMMLPNPRLETLKRVRRSRLGKAVIWCRFNKDIEAVLGEYNTAVDFYGDTSKENKQQAKLRFSDPHDHDVLEFVSNPSAGGTGVDGLQRTGRTAIYYSNSYNAIHRWQSEDRTNRIGMGGTCTYIDLVARNTVDVSILSNLRKKKALSDLTLDEIRLMLIGAEDNANIVQGEANP